MNKINCSRLILGGLVAGVILNIGEFLLNGVVLAKQMQEAFERFRVPQPGTTFMIVATVLTLLLGLVLIWLYALIRPRMGPGPKTAIVAAVILWFAICVYTGIINTLIWDISFNLLLIGLVWCFFEYAIAAMVGAWLYREE